MVKKGRPPVVASTPMPLYCIRMLGPKHVLVAGGGGAAKTGVGNELRVYSIEADETKLVKDSTPSTLCAKLVQCFDFDTATLATMNCDMFPVDSNLGRYLIACGQENECHFYSTDYILDSDVTKETPVDQIPQITFRFKHLKSFTSDFHPKLPFQKVVRLSPHDGKILATGGADGYLRLWAWPSLEKKVEICAHKDDIDDLDLSKDANFVITVGHDHKSYIWSTTGDKIQELPTPPEIPPGYRVRLVRFTTLGTRSHVFITASVPIKRSTKQNASFLTLWVYQPQIASCRPATTKSASDDVISAMSLTNDSTYTAIGTLGGSVAIYDTAELTLLKYISETHGIFVTGVSFVPLTSFDPQQNNVALNYLFPDCKAVILSISADNTIQLHQLLSPKSTSITSTLWRTVFTFNIVYFLMKLLRL